MAPWASRPVIRSLLFTVSGMVVVFSPLAFEGGLYASPQLAAGFFGSLVVVAMSPAIFLFASFARLYTYFAPAKGKTGAGQSASIPEPDYSPHALAGLARWSQLVDEQDSAAKRDAESVAAIGTPSLLLQHQQGDSLCPCVAPACTGSLLRSAPLLGFLEAVTRMTVTSAGFVLALSNPLLVHGGAFWASWWAVSGALALLALLNYVPVNVMGRFTTNASLLRLSLRIQRRAMFVALRDFIDSFDRAIFGGEASTELPDARLYPKLHYRLADTWEKRVPFLVSGRLFLGLVSITFALPTVVNLAVGSCIPAYSVVLLVLLLVVTITDLTHVALSNEQIEKITELYRQAQTGIRDKLVRARRLPPDPARAPLLEALREHDRLLESFREVAGFRGRFLGFVVDFGVLRTFLVTVFTLLVGLWSILRGSIVFTLDSVCPSR